MFLRLNPFLASLCVCNRMTYQFKRLLNDPGAQPLSHLMVHQNPLGKPLSLSFFPYSFLHIKQTASAKRFMHVDFGSLKNDPQQSCFFTLIMKSNIHEMDFSLCSPTHSSHRCVFAAVFSLCLYSLVRVNGFLKAHFQATQLITQG